MAKIVRALSEDGGAFAAAIDAADMVNELIRIHGLNVSAAAHLGKLALACSLMGSLMKNSGDKLTLSVNSGGTLGSLLAESDYMGNVRAKADNPHAFEEPLVTGSGTFHSIKDIGLKVPHSAQVPLQSPDIADNVMAYYILSEQIPTFCAFQLSFEGGKAVYAGGYIVQALPPVSKEVIKQIEVNAAVPVALGTNAEQLALAALAGMNANLLDSWDCFVHCSCSAEHTIDMLAALPKPDLEALFVDGENIEVCCDFCGKRYVFNSEQAKKLISLE
ncbi:MAG: Hsp33 family molecular chaperone HslO [Oscillospiraceae bacterium]|jgi:molecular chaperone Hsp33|nr:Hsp33 family molecular chaperone HslO [Oscillospiraceae bacterium]